jgi:hypothetical protein
MLGDGGRGRERWRERGERGESILGHKNSHIGSIDNPIKITSSDRLHQQISQSASHVIYLFMLKLIKRKKIIIKKK